jgi:Raf kinase inhibitor-like YbhB/YbcL family protein
VSRREDMAGRPGRWAGAGLAMVLLAGCGLLGGPKTVQGNVPDTMTVTSPVFSQGVMGRPYTCLGGGKSPAIRWSGAPPDTKSLALVMDDAAAPITPYIYWIVFDIGPQATDIPDGAIPPGALVADNSMGSSAYDAPCGAKLDHSYRFTVYALNTVLRLRRGTGAKTAWQAIAAAAIARGRLTVCAVGNCLVAKRNPHK